MLKEKIEYMLPSELKEKINIVSYDTVDSTNAIAKAAARKGVSDTVFIAERQTAGRGRLGRSFSSDIGGIYMSVLYKAGESAVDSLKITVRCAAAVSRAIESKTPLKTRIKWVNDIFYQGKKLSGILAEGVFSPSGELTHVIVGIGINVRSVNFPGALSDIAGAIGDFCIPPDKEELIASVIKEFYSAKDEDFSSVLDYYKERMLYIGDKVNVIKYGKEYEARCVGIDAEGHILVENEVTGVSALDSAEISVRRVEND